MITLAVIDDDRMLLTGMTAWLTDVGDIRLAAIATTAAELVEARTCADVALLDLRLRDGSAPADNIRALCRAGMRVLVISTVADPGQAAAALRAGADGYLTKDHDLPALAEAVRAVAAGETVFSPELADALAHDPAGPRLSEQERKVLIAYASGMTLAAVARRVGISPHTAKDYLDRVKDKYRAMGRPAFTKLELADRAREDGLLGGGYL